MPSKFKLAAIFAACTALAACGGTDPKKETANRMNLSVAATSESVAGNFVSVSATVTSSPSSIATMSWTVQKIGTGPDITLVNSDCKIRAVSSSGTTLDPVSTWTCAVDILTPVSVTQNTDYRLVVTSTDAKGNSTNAQNVLTVKPSTTPPPTVSIIGQNSAKSGDLLSYNCQGAGGTTAVKDKYSYQWVVTQRNGVDPFTISSPKDANVGQFIAPVVSQPQTITIGCRVTDDIQRTGLALQEITISPVAAPRIVPQIVDGQTFAAGASTKLDGSKTAWIDHLGNVVKDKPIYFYWSQKAGPRVEMFNITSSMPTVVFPTNIATTPETKDAYVFTMSVSDQPISSGIPVSAYQTVELVMYVNNLPQITIVGGAAATFKSGTLGLASITATGQAGLPLYYSWTQVSGPMVTIGGANRNAISFVAPTLTGTETVPIVFRVAVSYAPIDSRNNNLVLTDVLVAVTP